MRARSALPALFALCLLISHVESHAQSFDHEEIITEKVKARPGQTLVVDVPRGSLAIVGRGGSAVDMRVVKGANNVSADRAQELFDDYEVRVRETADGVEVRATHRGSRWGRNRLQVRYEISVPERYNVALQTSGGSIRVATLDGTAEVETAGGSLTFDDISGPIIGRTAGGSIEARRVDDRVEVRTSGGSIRVEDVAGPVRANTSGGSIRVAGADGDVDARTSGGSIKLTDISGTVSAVTSGGGVEAEVVGQPERPMQLKTSGGSVRLRIHPEVRADIAARANGGRVHSDLPVTVRGEIRPNRLEGELNGGGPLISLESNGGGVYIDRR